MQSLSPPKLKPGDEIRVISPSRSLAIISKETRAITNRRFAELGLKLSFGKYVEEMKDFRPMLLNIWHGAGICEYLGTLLNS